MPLPRFTVDEAMGFDSDFDTPLTEADNLILNSPILDGIVSTLERNTIQPEWRQYRLNPNSNWWDLSGRPPATREYGSTHTVTNGVRFYDNLFSMIDPVFGQRHSCRVLQDGSLQISGSPELLANAFFEHFRFVFSSALNESYQRGYRDGASK